MTPIPIGKLHEELESELYSNPASAQCHIVLHSKRMTDLYIWTRALEQENGYVLVAKVIDRAEIIRAYSAHVIDFIDMAHVRNWIMKNCADLVDSSGFLCSEKFLKYTKGSRRPDVNLNYLIR